jgi:predicted DNA-binding transcriptional regulator AlpA
MQTEDEMLDAGAVAAIVGGPKGPVSKATVFRLARRGAIPQPVRFSQRLVRWSKVGLLESLSRKTTCTSMAHNSTKSEAILIGSTVAQRQ